MSGACLLVRRKAIDETGGFDPAFFLYFEDFDWTMRLNKITRTAYVPSVEVVHHGGGAARKGMRHIGWFVKQRLALLPQARLEVVLRPAPVASSTGADGFIGRALDRAAACGGVVTCARSCASRTAICATHRARRARGATRRARAGARGRRPSSTSRRASHVMHDARRGRRAARIRLANRRRHGGLARAAVAAGVARFVFASSVKVNGDATRPGRPFGPDDRAGAARTPTARSKRDAEARSLDITRGIADRRDHPAHPAGDRTGRERQRRAARRRGGGGADAAVRRDRQPAQRDRPREPVRRDRRGARRDAAAGGVHFVADAAPRVHAGARPRDREGAGACRCRSHSCRFRCSGSPGRLGRARRRSIA